MFSYLSHDPSCIFGTQKASNWCKNQKEAFFVSLNLRRIPPFIGYTTFTLLIHTLGGIPIERQEIFQEITKERARQEKIHPLPKIKKTDSADLMAVTQLIINSEFLSVLVEEIGEVAQALQGDGDLREELIQVASVSVRWLENI